MDTQTVNIAFVTDNKSTISQHFGRAMYYEVLTLENNKIIKRETRDKMGHAQFSGDPHEHDQPGQGHGFGAAAQHRHGQMLDAIRDCAVLVARGMGSGAYEHLRAAGIQPILTDVLLIDDAAREFMEGSLIDHPEKLH